MTTGFPDADAASRLSWSCLSNSPPRDHFIEPDFSVRLGGLTKSRDSITPIDSGYSGAPGSSYLHPKPDHDHDDLVHRADSASLGDIEPPGFIKKIATNVIKYRCRKCRILFTKINSLESHYVLFHALDNIPIACTLCGQVSTSKACLGHPVKSRFTIEPLDIVCRIAFSCSICPENYSRNIVIGRRERLHTSNADGVHKEPLKDGNEKGVDDKDGYYRGTQYACYSGFSRLLWGRPRQRPWDEAEHTRIRSLTDEDAQHEKLTHNSKSAKNILLHLDKKGDLNSRDDDNDQHIDDLSKVYSVDKAGQKNSVSLTPESLDTDSKPLPKIPSVERCATPSTVLDDSSDDSEDQPSTYSSEASSTSIWPSSPNPVERGDLVVSILDDLRRQIVDQLMQEVYILLSRQTGTRSRTSAQSSRDESQGVPAAGSAETKGGISSLDNKRKRCENYHSGSDIPGDCDDDGGPSQRQKTKLSRTDDQPRKLACPYFKRNPRLHQGYRSCAGPGWNSCHRVKEHLYRRHKLPIICDRCRTTFPNDRELSDHRRRPESCALQRADSVEGIDKLQEAQLRTRKKFIGTEEQRWKEMFFILFPDDNEDSMPSPYYDTDSDLTKHSDQLAEYDRYMARELPRLVRVELETAVLGASSSLESGLQAQLIDIIRNCQRQVFETYATELNPQAPATITVTGSVINDPAPLIAPPEDNALADINAFFPPPAFPDNNSPSPNEYALTDSNEWSCPITYSDSGYGSQRVNTRNGGERLWQNSFFTGHLADEDSDILSQLLPYDVSTDLPQVKDAESTYMEPCWDLSGFDSTHAQG